MNTNMRLWLVDGRNIDTMGDWGMGVTRLKSAIALDSIGPRPALNAVPRRVPVGTLFYEAQGVTVYHHGDDTLPWVAVERVP